MSVCLYAGKADGDSESLIRDQRVWSVVECAEIFCRSVTELKQQLANITNKSTDTNDTLADGSGPPTMLVWDKVLTILIIIIDNNNNNNKVSKYKRTIKAGLAGFCRKVEKTFFSAVKTGLAKMAKIVFAAKNRFLLPKT